MFPAGRYILCLGTIVLFLVSCRRSTPLQKEDVVFFSSSFYFDKEIATWKSMTNAVLTKAVTSGTGDVETTESMNIPVEKINWDKELSLFREAEINKPALREKYTVEASGGLVSYSANDPKMKVQNIMVFTDEQDTIEIIIHTHTENFLSKSDYILMYRPGKGYIIEGKQEPKFFGKERIFSISATL